MRIAIYSRGLEQDLRDQLVMLISELQRHNISILLLESLMQFNLPINMHNVELFSNSSGLDAKTDFSYKSWRRWNHA